MMDPDSSRAIVAHFIWTIAIAALVFPINSHLSHFTILFNAGFVTVLAAARHEPLSARKITRWDEAAAFFGIVALGHFLH